MDFFFLMFHDLENINDGQKRVKEKIHNTVEIGRASCRERV